MKEMTLRELQIFSLEILKDVHDFCVQHNFKYSLAYGTLIGAIRHKGFIPWDDDIDIIMPRPDYEMFCRSFKSSKYKIANEKESYIAFARVYDDEKTLNVASAPWKKGNSGVWIDIFPVDCVPDNPTEFANLYWKANRLVLKQWQLRAVKKTIRDTFKVYPIVTAVVKLFRAWGGRLLLMKSSLQSVNKEYNQLITQYKWGFTSHWAQLACADNGPSDYGETEWLDTYELVKFEDTELYIMRGYDLWLLRKYGNYMELPPENEREQHTLAKSKFYWK